MGPTQVHLPTSHGFMNAAGTSHAVVIRGGWVWPPGYYSEPRPQRPGTRGRPGWGAEWARSRNLRGWR